MIEDRTCFYLMLACLLLGIALGWIICRATTKPPQPQPVPGVLYFRIGPSLGLPTHDNSPTA